MQNSYVVITQSLRHCWHKIKYSMFLETIEFSNGFGKRFTPPQELILLPNQRMSILRSVFAWSTLSFCLRSLLRQYILNFSATFFIYWLAASKTLYFIEICSWYCFRKTSNFKWLDVEKKRQIFFWKNAFLQKSVTIALNCDKISSRQPISCVGVIFSIQK